MATHVRALTKSPPSICREGWPRSRFDASKVDMLALEVGRSEEDSIGKAALAVGEVVDLTLDAFLIWLS